MKAFNCKNRPKHSVKNIKKSGRMMGFQVGEIISYSNIMGRAVGYMGNSILMGLSSGWDPKHDKRAVALIPCGGVWAIKPKYIRRYNEKSK